MNLPGFTAEQSLKQPQAHYWQRAMGGPEAAVGKVRPQISPLGIGLPANFVWTVANMCCLNGNLGCCRVVGNILANTLGSR